MIGKASAALVGLFVLLVVVASRVPSESAMLLIAGAGIFLFVAFLGFLLHIAKRHPALAATEGPTYIQSRQLDLAAKGVQLPPPTTFIPDPQNPIVLEHGEGQ